MFIVSKANKIIDWMDRNFISEKANVVLKIYKILIRPRIEYCTQTLGPVSKQKIYCKIESEGYTKNSDKNNKKNKRLQLQWEIVDLG